MIDKQLVKQRFSKSLKTYNDNAFVQKRMAERLISMLPAGEYNSILEIGAGTGILTEKAVRNIKFKEYSCIDLAEEAEEYIKRIIPESSFTAGDIEAMPIKGRYDLIISKSFSKYFDGFKDLNDGKCNNNLRPRSG